MIETRLSVLMDEITTAYQVLLYSLNRFTCEIFAADTSDSQIALHSWLTSLEERADISLEIFRFSDKLAQGLVQIALHSEVTQGASFWEHLSKAILGITLNDWNDRSVENFKRSLIEAKERTEREIFELAIDEIIS